MNNALEQFRDAIRTSGLQPPDVIEPDRFLRFPGEGKRKSNRAGWCKFFADGTGGIFGDFSTGLSANWQAKRDTPYKQAEKEAFMRHVFEAKAQAEADQQSKYDQAAIKAKTIWEVATPAPENHPYLLKKQIKAHGARLYRGSLVIGGMVCDGALIVPMGIGSEIHSLQLIAADGDRRFLPCGRTKNCYFVLGDLTGVAAVMIAEGFATGASIHEGTGHPVVVAFSAGNLESVAKTIHSKMPNLPVIICADDDWKSSGNPGITKATEAAKSVGGIVAVPVLGADRPDFATDFNDMARLYGQEALERAIAVAIASARGKRQPSSRNAQEADHGNQ
jgi:putative DNA primase/helicase